jgi:hypothetical protein
MGDTDAPRPWPRNTELPVLILLVFPSPATEEFLKCLSGSRGGRELLYDPITRAPPQAGVRRAHFGH